MANRNKKKGFMEGMKGVKGMKIVFGGNVDVDVGVDVDVVDRSDGSEDMQVDERPLDGGSANEGDAADTAENGMGDGAAEQMQEESEVEEIPVNVFITTKEYIRPRGGWAAKAPMRDDTPEYAGYELEAEPSPALIMQDEGEIFAKVERQYDSLPDLQADHRLAEGSMLAWKVC
jgi:hypothetical protein